MPFSNQSFQRGRSAPYIVICIAVLFVVSVGLACNSPQPEYNKQTEIALNVQATQLAFDTKETASAPEQNPLEQETITNIQATQDAQIATQSALDEQSTIAAQQITDNLQATNTPLPATATAPPIQPTSTEQDFETWMSTASILLYEDMAGDLSLYRFIRLALDGMGLGYTDVGDALGNYKTQLLSGGPGGRGWDLIISGKELRSAVSGEFYVYINEAINLGSSVIIEEWDIDNIGSGKISTILSRCGISLHRDWQNVILDKQLLYPIDGTDPVHHFPNEGISLTNPSNYWTWNIYDLGDLMQLTPGSKAKLIWGARTNIKDSYATAVSCIDDRLIIQTYASHNYGQDRIVMMWQNYIYSVLNARYDYLATH
ncbi:MAG: hypothetical protein IZT55_02080 [Anaerolineae bacterium]|nr:hypothetical protein [Anaerolineae bacterium]